MAPLDADVPNGDASYTGALQQVFIGLGRIDGKLDAFDQRLRSVEEQQAVWRASQPDAERWKQRVEDNATKIAALEQRRSIGDALKHYWYVAVLVVLPVAVNTISTITHFRSP